MALFDQAASTMSEDEFIQALVAAKNPTQVQDAFIQMAAASQPPADDLSKTAKLLEDMRLRREIAPTPMDSGTFFQRLLQQGGGKPIPLK